MNQPKKPIKVVAGLDARKGILNGAQIAANAIGCTFGPRGGTVLLEKAFNHVAVTSDGVTVSREVKPGAGLVGLGATMIKEACLKVEQMAGDGTTTTAILAYEAMEASQKLVVAGYCPMQMSREMKNAADVAVSLIQEISTPVKTQGMIESVALLASNGDQEVAEALAKATMMAGSEGTVSVEDGMSLGIEIETKDGLEIPSGFISPHFIPNEIEREMTSPLVAILGTGVQAVEDIRHVLEEASQWPDNHLLIFAPFIEGPALQTMVMNYKKGVINSCAVKVPGSGRWQEEWMQNLAAVTGATYADPNQGFNFRAGFDPAWFGSVHKATVGAKKTVLEAFPEAMETISERVNQIKTQAETSVSDYDADRLNEQAAGLAGGLIILKVGGVTEAAMKERRARIEDSLGAVRGALEEGVIPGAGNGLLLVADILEAEANDRKGWHIVAQALRAPFNRLAESCETNNEVAKMRLELANADIVSFEGFDPVRKEVRNLLEGDLLVDSAKMARCAVSTAMSVAGTVITAETALIQTK
tara:strand:- start:11639 stop:13231 length:1593 start_codon:yes stop_codon:yes gene_type:complete